VQWLYDWWERIDTWISENRPGISEDRPGISEDRLWISEDRPGGGETPALEVTETTALDM
jgi:hypothetical protein